MLKQNSSVKPKYILIRDEIKKAIMNNVYNTETGLPSERELSEMYSVSRVTVRKALNELENEGLTYTIKGKGAFVSGNKISQNLGYLASFSDDMASRRLKPSSKILALEVIPATKTIADNLNINYAEEVIMLKRLRLANNEPMAIETAYLPIKFKHFLMKNLKDNVSLYKLLETYYNVRAQRALQSFELSKLEIWESDLLGEDSCIFIQRKTYDLDNNVVEFVESKYRGSKYKFCIELFLKR
ncbi:MAG TPA: GntR family transcriptional regulator [Clostridiales bacterium]|nr:GntR family transcriptional regulator [Clostridiales bacterium]